MYGVYLAGPITGLSWQEATGWREEVKVALAGVAVALDPLEGEERRFSSFSSIPSVDDPNIFWHDTDLIRLCDFLFVNLTHGNGISVGTMFEIGFAHALGKRIIVVKPEGMHHLFLSEPVEAEFSMLKDAVEYIRQACSLTTSRM